MFLEFALFKHLANPGATMKTPQPRVLLKTPADEWFPPSRLGQPGFTATRSSLSSHPGGPAL